MSEENNITVSAKIVGNVVRIMELAIISGNKELLVERMCSAQLEVERLLAEEQSSAIQDLRVCLEEAPVDFMGTGSNWSGSEKERKDWIKKWENALRILESPKQ